MPLPAAMPSDVTARRGVERHVEVPLRREHLQRVAGPSAPSWTQRENAPSGSSRTPTRNSPSSAPAQIEYERRTSSPSTCVRSVRYWPG